MFPAQNPGEYEPVRVRRRQQPPSPHQQQNGTSGAEDTDHQQHDSDDDSVWEEDPVSEEGAIWPIKGGRIVDWPCFYALIAHVHNTINPPFHTPILLISEPVWTLKEYEKVTRFIFEKFKVPAYSMMDSALAAAYAYGVPTATVIDVGLDKADVTCVAEFMLQSTGRSLAVSDCGGEAMTRRLTELLSSKSGFTRNVCEQLKKSPVCEILGSDVLMPDEETSPADVPANPAAAASTGADGADPGQRKASIIGELPRGPGPGTEVGEEKKLEDEGVLDIASIVTGGNMNEYLAQKDKEKQEKAAARQMQKKSADAQQAAARLVRLPNSKRSRNTFTYEDVQHRTKNRDSIDLSIATAPPTLDESSTQQPENPDPSSAAPDKPADGGIGGVTDGNVTENSRREIEVGPERFQAATGGILDTLADAIHRTIQSCTEINKRGDLWDCLIMVGNGAKVRGFREALVDKLQKKFIISPSSATMFTSELPSNLSTPMGTGAQTPQLQMPGQQMLAPHGGVNPLLLAATTAQNPQLHHASSHLGQPGGVAPHVSHGSHAQTPTNIRLAKIPEYFPEWKEVGYDEAAFLGAQVAAKVLFINDGGASNGYMTRTGYNEQGPSGIHETML